MVLDIALLSKNCHMVGPDHPNKIFLGNHLTETERGGRVVKHLLLVEDQVHCHLLMSSLHLTSLPPSLTWAQPSQGLAQPGCLRHRRKQGRPSRPSRMAKISLVLTLLATLGSSPNRPLLPPEPPAGLRRHQLLHGGAGLWAHGRTILICVPWCHRGNDERQAQLTSSTGDDLSLEENSNITRSRLGSVATTSTLSAPHLTSKGKSHNKKIFRGWARAGQLWPPNFSWFNSDCHSGFHYALAASLFWHQEKFSRQELVLSQL